MRKVNKLTQSLTVSQSLLQFFPMVITHSHTNFVSHTPAHSGPEAEMPLGFVFAAFVRGNAIVRLTETETESEIVTERERERVGSRE